MSVLVEITSGSLGPIVTALFFVVVGVVGIACALGVLCLLSPKARAFLSSIKF